jgi:hypothetical protein
MNCKTTQREDGSYVGLPGVVRPFHRFEARKGHRRSVAQANGLHREAQDTGQTLYMGIVNEWLSRRLTDAGWWGVSCI